MSPYANKMVDYISAEKSGAVEGECWKYYKDCPQSLFEFKERNKYTKEAQDNTEADHKSSSSSNAIEMLINEVMLWYLLSKCEILMKKSTVYYYYYYYFYFLKF